MKFTDNYIKSLKPTGTQYQQNESGGLAIRISAKGKKTWLYNYWLKNKAKRMVLGIYPSISLLKARKLAVEAATLKDQGIDPIEHKKQLELQEKLDKQKAIQSMAWLSEEFYKTVLLNRKVPQQVRQQLDADIIPGIGAIHIDDISTRDITQFLQKIVDRGSPVHSNKVLSTIKQMFNFALSRGITQRNPAAAIRSRDVGGVEVSRNRPLSYAEIKTIFQFLDGDTHRIRQPTIIGMKILMLTGVRTGSLIQAEWDEVDFENSLWTIPPEHQKLKKSQPHNPFPVHISPWVKELLQMLREQSESRFLIPGRGATAENDFHAERTVFSTVARLNSDEIGIPKFNIHDFRSTLATRLSEEGIAPHVIELILGHQLGGVAGIYNKHQYLTERMHALDLWSEKIMNLTSNSNVVAING